MAQGGCSPEQAQKINEALRGGGALKAANTVRRSAPGRSVEYFPILPREKNSSVLGSPDTIIPRKYASQRQGSHKRLLLCRCRQREHSCACAAVCRQGALKKAIKAMRPQSDAIMPQLPPLLLAATAAGVSRLPRTALTWKGSRLDTSLDFLRRGGTPDLYKKGGLPTVLHVGFTLLAVAATRSLHERSPELETVAQALLLALLRAEETARSGQARTRQAFSCAYALLVAAIISWAAPHCMRTRKRLARPGRACARSTTRLTNPVQLRRRSQLRRPTAPWPLAVCSPE